MSPSLEVRVGVSNPHSQTRIQADGGSTILNMWPPRSPGGCHPHHSEEEESISENEEVFIGQAWKGHTHIPRSLPMRVTQSYDHTELQRSLEKQDQLYVQEQEANTDFVE